MMSYATWLNNFIQFLTSLLRDQTKKTSTNYIRARPFNCLDTNEFFRSNKCSFHLHPDAFHCTRQIISTNGMVFNKLVSWYIKNNKLLVLVWAVTRITKYQDIVQMFKDSLWKCLPFGTPERKTHHIHQQHVIARHFQAGSFLLQKSAFNPQKIWVNFWNHTRFRFRW